jgi:hypothetical protein
LLLITILNGCATALKRDGRCLASLTPDYLQAQEALAKLEDDWHRAVAARDRRLGQAGFSDRWTRENDLILGAPAVPQRRSAPAPREEDEATAAYHRWQAARLRLKPTLDWYHRVYRRVSERIEEDQILTEAGMALMPTPAILFYPIVRWNVRSVLWNGADPDAAGDEVTRFCGDRLADEAGRDSPVEARPALVDSRTKTD